ncbi:TetR/AcrR family transcriptional regulator [Mycobacterium intracellulare]|uniref:TetR/AcrR family transcriptional regulator n=1 Tax=Mycobacterium intracellulare TaxID=1767 RepID=UPI00044ABCF6|nr:bacterial regulatory s, tetR family protein [Mycobacterium intracellulare MIN_052511_1280]MCA2323210.1 TetR/AcrR family transcriptional regulator [Mycobacterium intracellulare]MCA2344080.1 TetR/AcrR family transcriptional regulator [Mycobacterium intracellulare]
MSAARVTKGAVYHHFSDKHSLFAAVLDQYNEAARRQVYDAIGEHPTDPGKRRWRACRPPWTSVWTRSPHD